MSALKKLNFDFDRRPYAAEFIGTFAFVFIGAGSIISAAYMGASGSSALLGIALAHGLAILVMVSATAEASGGHLNPAVTLGVMLRGEIKCRRALGYMIAQFIGAATAAALLTGVNKSLELSGLTVFEQVESAKLGLPMVAEGLIPFAFLLEILLTLFLVFVVLRTAVEQKLSWAPVAIGLTVAADVLVGGPISGAAMNPARWFGPALLTMTWKNHFVYWLAPFAGALLAYALNLVVSKKSDRQGGDKNGE